MTWVADSCSFVLANNGWSNAGVSNLSVIETGEDRYRFLHWMAGCGFLKGGIGEMESTCGDRMQTIDRFYPPGIRGVELFFHVHARCLEGRVSGR